MRSLSAMIAALLLGTAGAGAADEPSGCDKFKWDVSRERAALVAAGQASIASGSDLAGLSTTGLTLALRARDEAGLPRPPEQAPKESSFSGFVRVAAPPRAGAYTISLSAQGWIDVVQDGSYLKPAAFSGVTGCDGIRKTVRYELAASPILLQISGVAEKSVSFVILPVD